MKSVRLSLAIGFMGLALAACDTTSAVMWSSKDLITRIFRSPDVNLNEKSIAAADYIVPQIKTYIKRTDVISTTPLTLAKESAATSEFGRVVPAQIAERLRALGYTVIMPDENGVSPTGKFVIGGTYDRDSRDTFVNLRITNTETGQVVGSFDYNMPSTSEIKKLSNPEARIMRLEE